MEITQESFDTLTKRNAELEAQIHSDKEFSKIYWLNQSQNLSKVGSWHWDVTNNKVQWSDMMFKLLGLQPNQQPPSYELALHYVHDMDKKAYESTLALAMENKADYYFKNKIVKEDKSTIDVISRGVCVCNEEGVLTAMMGTIQDITQINELLDANKQLEQFANILSHDFKTPIRSIISFVGLIREHSLEDLADDGKEYFSYVENGARDLYNLVTDILEYSKLNAPGINIKETSIKDLISAIIFDFNVDMKENKGEISLGWLPASVKIDKIKIRQVVQNLIANAIKYCKPGIKPEIHIYCEESENQFTFFVKDNGIGVGIEYANKIFEAYVRIHDDKSFSGTGIGLSTCKRIIKLHHGHIGYWPNPEGGTCFYFSIPK